jgi:hypothetical protein
MTDLLMIQAVATMALFVIQFTVVIFNRNSGNDK